MLPNWKMNRFANKLRVTACAVLLLPALVRAAEVSISTEDGVAIDPTPHVKCTIMDANQRTAEVKLVGRAGTQIAYTAPNASGAAPKLLDRGVIQESYFELDLERGKLDELVRNRR